MAKNYFLALAGSFLVSLTACSGTSQSAPPGGATDGGGSVDGGGGDGGLDPDAGDGGAGGHTFPVAFAYTPQWQGVTQVEVFGAFGQPGDWTQPLTTLSSDGAGGFTGKAQLPAGQYPYVFHVIGDAAAGANAATFSRHTVDPGNSQTIACPAASPTFSKIAQHPCSQLAVPQAAVSPKVHIKGTITVGGQPAAGYLVELQSDNSLLHHFFANRTTTGPDGAYDLLAASAEYRVEALHPTFYSQDDTQRDPVALAAMKSAFTARASVKTDLTFIAVDMANTTYAQMTPKGMATALPTTFTYALVPGAKDARLVVYGGGPRVVAPWFSGTYATTPSAVFNGTFTSKSAKDPQVKSGKVYFWGVEEHAAPAATGAGWTLVSMVLPVQWP